LDSLLERLKRQTERLIERRRERFEQLQLKLQTHHPAEQLSKMIEKQQMLTKSLEKEMQALLKQKQLQFTALLSQLHVLSPLKIMERGYSLVYNEKEELVKSIHQLQPGDAIQVRLQDGRLDCYVWGMEEERLHE
jgi:exodeoxyribonuclease VII large subunit